MKKKTKKITFIVWCRRRPNLGAVVTFWLDCWRRWRVKVRLCSIINYIIIIIINIIIIIIINIIIIIINIIIIIINNIIIIIINIIIIIIIINIIIIIINIIIIIYLNFPTSTRNKNTKAMKSFLRKTS